MDHTASIITNEQPKEARNYGLDLLKAVAMMMVVTLHVLGHGGVLDHTTLLSPNYTLAWAFESLAYAAVDVYVIITGYLYAGRQNHTRNLIGLWFQVFFYSMLIPIVLKLFGYDVGIKPIVCGFFPILTQRYWFFNAYFALFCFIPVLNALSENEKMLRRTLLVSIALFSVLPVFGFGSDLFKTNQGSSFLWFTILYLSGAYLKKNGIPPFIEKHSIRLFFLSSFLLLLSRLILIYLTSRFLEEPRGDLFYTYSSPLVYICALSIVAGFRKISVPSTRVKKAAMLLSTLSFDVYLIHDNPVFREHIIKDAFSSYSDKGLILMTVCILATVLAIFLAGELVGFFRSKLFAALHIKKLAYSIGQAMDSRIESFTNRTKAT